MTEALSTETVTLPDVVSIDGVRYQRLDRIATRVSCWSMYDAHLFKKVVATTVDGVIDEWRRICQHEKHEYYGAPDMLCPVIVMEGEKELRRVGVCVHGLSDTKNLAEWREQCLADADIVRLLAQGKNDE